MHRERGPLQKGCRVAKTGDSNDSGVAVESDHIYRFSSVLFFAFWKNIDPVLLAGPSRGQASLGRDGTRTSSREKN